VVELITALSRGGLRPSHVGFVREEYHARLDRLSGSVLEVGVGIRPRRESFARATTVVAVDLSATRLAADAQATAGPLRLLAVADGHSLPVRSGKFNAVVASFLLCQRDVRPAALLSEFERVLAPGGYLLLLDHVKASGVLPRTFQRARSALRARRGRCRRDTDVEALLHASLFALEYVVRSDHFEPWQVAVARAPS